MITSYSFGKTLRAETLRIGTVVAAYIQDRKYTIPVKMLGMYREENGVETLTDSVAISKMQENEFYLIQDLEDGRCFNIVPKYVGRCAGGRNRLIWGHSPVSFREISDIRED